MANAGIFVGFGQATRGREGLALAAFNEALEYYGRLQQEGVIESFEPVLLDPHGGDLGGFILLRGDRDRLAHLQATDEFRHLTLRAALCVDSIGTVGATLGDGLGPDMAFWSEEIAKL